MILELKNIVKRYDDFVAVDHLNLTVNEGEIYGLLGPNGAGKTTTINTILGLTKLSEGSIEVFGKELKHNESKIKSQIGMVPQEIAVYNELTAYENVAFFGKLYGLRGKKLKENIKEVLEFTGLWEHRKKLPRKFSGGMKRRLNIACAVVHKPKLIIMDEPTVGIDPQSRNHILGAVKKLNQEGSTIIYTSHYMEEVETICSYISIMDNGRVIAKGTKEELKEMVTSAEKLIIDVKDVNYSFVEAIKAHEYVTEANLIDDQLIVVAEIGKFKLSELVSIGGKFGVEIDSVHKDKATLETVFLTLTGRKLRD